MTYRTRPALLIGLALMACSELPPSGPAGLDPDLAYARAPSNPDPTATVKIPLDDAALSLRSDRAFSDGIHSVYANGVCGITARIYLGGSGDMVLLGGSPRDADNSCAFYPRRYTVLYPGGGSDVVTAWTIAVTQLQNSSFSIPVGTSALRGFM